MAERRRRFDTTTEHLRRVAEQLLLDRGSRALTLESLAEHGFASVGSVYERWSSRTELIDDLVANCLGPLADQLVSGDEAMLVEVLRALIDSADGERVGVWLVELLHLARDLPELAHHAHRLVHRLATWLGTSLETSEMDAADRGAQWWAMANVVGHAQLRLGGAQLPPMAAEIARLATRGGSVTGGPVIVSTSDLPSPRVPPAPPLDDTGARVVGVTRRLIAEAGGDPKIRDVLVETGLASGSLYRRFDSKRSLMLSVLHHELGTTSYDWVQHLVDAAVSSDPIGAMAAVFRQRFESLLTDPDTRNVILELTAQARIDDGLRRTVIAQVEHVAEVRAVFFQRFADAGVLAAGISPDVCGWLVQCPAAGYRLMVGAGLRPDGAELEAAVARVFWNLVSP